MLNIVFTLCLSVLVLLTSGQAQAQTTLGQIQSQAEAALVAGDPERTAELANAMLAVDPDQFAALFLLAVAQAELGQHREAARNASRAYNVAPTAKTRLQAARLAASERAELRQYVRAEFWLRRGANNISDDEDAEAIVRQFVAISQANPFSAQFNFSAAPTDNINGGAESETFRLEGSPFDFFLPPERLPLEGTLYVADALIGYRLSENAIQRTSIDSYIYAQTGRLTSSAKERVPDFPEDSFDLLAVDLSLTHQRQFQGAPGPSLVRLGYGEVWNASGSISTSLSLSLGQVFVLSNGDQISIEGAYSEQESLSEVTITSDLANAGNLEFRDGATYALSGSYGMSLDDGGRLSFSLSSKLNDGGFENTFSEHSGRLVYSFTEPELDVQITASYELGYREYEEIFLSLDGRRDIFRKLSLSGVFTRASYFGFSPSVTVNFTRTLSDVDVFSSSRVDIRYSLRSVF